MTEQEIWREKVYHPENFEAVDDSFSNWAEEQLDALNVLLKQSMCEHDYEQIKSKMYCHLCDMEFDLDGI